jgi:hypothetical protein
VISACVAGSLLGLSPPLAGLVYETIARRSPFWLGILRMAVVVGLVAAPGRRQAGTTP